MRKVTLSHTALTCSALGFGCANLLGRFGRRDSLDALSHAFDHGVNYFDIARSYGWGQAEGLLGSFLAGGRRGQAVIATKLGILPPKRNLVLDFAKPIARQVFKVFSSLRMRSATQFVQSQVVRHATSRTATGQFDPVTAKKSLDTSLKELKTDYVDILFLHCCTLDDVRGGEIFDFLRNSVSAGKVRYLGLSTDLDNTNQIMAVFPDVQVVNLARNLVADDINRLEQKDQVAVVTYAPLGGGLFNDSITRMVREQRNELGKWSQMTGLDLRESAAWSRLFLRYAYESNPAGVVVCGMHSKAHIINNIDATASEPAGSPRFFTAAAEIRRVLAHGA